MKNKLRFIAAIFALLTFSSLIAAQNNEDLEKQIEEKVERPPQQKLSRTQADSVFLTDARAAGCPLGLQQVITAGIYDNLALPFEPTFKSAALTSVYPSPPYNFKDFDDPAVNKSVAHSFLLKSYKPCEGRACGALLEIQVCNSGRDLWQNDKIYVGSIVGNKFVASIFYGDIWKPTESGKCKNLSIPISPAAIASMSILEVMIQDDTTVDNMKLTLNY